MKSPFRRVPNITPPALITVVYGQSRTTHTEGVGMCWTGGGALNPCIAQVPDRCLMMNNASAPGWNENNGFNTAAWTPSIPSSLVPLRDCWLGNRATGWQGSSSDPLGQSLGTMMWKLDANDVAAGGALRNRVYLAAGRGGKRIAWLMPQTGTPPSGSLAPNGITFYQNMLAMVQKAKDYCVSQLKMPARIESVLWLQGEADYNVGTSYAVYKANLLSLIASMRTDLAAITGDSTPFPFIMDQVASDQKGGGNPASLAQLDIALENSDGNTYCIGANYSYPYNANVSLDGDSTGTAHMISEQQAAWGEAFAAGRLAIAGGGSPQKTYVNPATPGAIVTVGNVVTITPTIAAPPLVLDTTIPIALNYGFKLRDPGGATIAGVVVGATTITVTLSAAPSAGATLEYSYENPAGTSVTQTGQPFTNGVVDLVGTPAFTAGAWGNIRDSRAVTSTYGAPLKIYNWLCIGQWSIA